MVIGEVLKIPEEHGFTGNEEKSNVIAKAIVDALPHQGDELDYEKIGHLLDTALFNFLNGKSAISDGDEINFIIDFVKSLIKSASSRGDSAKIEVIKRVLLGTTLPEKIGPKIISLISGFVGA